ncbi:Hypothetical protein SMB2099_2370 [Serratia marcescens SMB2099]|nr:Hypothetical protein SMB2099_2370 [Serratia marcescens SMB2099]
MALASPSPTAASQAPLLSLPGIGHPFVSGEHAFQPALLPQHIKTASNHAPLCQVKHGGRRRFNRILTLPRGNAIVNMAVK